MKFHFLYLVTILFCIDFAHALDCPQGYYPVKSHLRNAYQKKGGVPVSSSIVKEQCRPYRVLKTLTPIFFSTIPANWPIQSEKFKPFSKDEKLKIHVILKMLPKKLTHVGDIKFYRAISDLNSPNPSVSSSEDKIITIYDSIRNHDLKRVIAHELAHLYWDTLSEAEQADYHMAAKWKVDRKLNVHIVQRARFAISDSIVGPAEDFANNVELFLFEDKSLSNEPEILKCVERMIK